MGSRMGRVHFRVKMGAWGQRGVMCWGGSWGCTHPVIPRKVWDEGIMQSIKKIHKVGIRYASMSQAYNSRETGSCWLYGKTLSDSWRHTHIFPRNTWTQNQLNHTNLILVNFEMHLLTFLLYATLLASKHESRPNTIYHPMGTYVADGWQLKR